jgi:hypothetical protein
MLCTATLNEGCLHLYDIVEFAKFLIQKGHNNNLWSPKVTLRGEGGGAYEDNMIKLKKSRMKYLIVQYYVTKETRLCVSLASSSSRNDISEHDMCGWVCVCPHALRNTNHQTNVHTLKIANVLMFKRRPRLTQGCRDDNDDD